MAAIYEELRSALGELRGYERAAVRRCVSAGIKSLDSLAAVVQRGELLQVRGVKYATAVVLCVLLHRANAVRPRQADSQLRC